MDNLSFWNRLRFKIMLRTNKKILIDNAAGFYYPYSLKSITTVLLSAITWFLHYVGNTSDALKTAHWNAERKRINAEITAYLSDYSQETSGLFVSWIMNTMWTGYRELLCLVAICM